MSSHLNGDLVNPTATTTSTNISIIPSNNNLSKENKSNTEQPQTKRQKIEKVKPTSKNSKLNTKLLTTVGEATSPPDIIDTDGEHTNRNNNVHLCSSLSSVAYSISTPSSSNNSPKSTPSSSRATSLCQLLNVQNIVNLLPCSVEVASIRSSHANSIEIGCNSEYGSISSASDQSPDETDRAILPDILPITKNISSSKQKEFANTAYSTANDVSSVQDMRDFEESLAKQCLCGVSERTLRKPFQSHYSVDANGQKRVANLNEWPTNKLLQFLSNLQLLFNIYLKQNSKGFICTRIMDVCDALIRNDHNLIDEIIVLAGCGNAYVQFLACRVLASFLVIAKQDMDDDWLKKIVENLFNFDHLDHVAVQKMHFSLEIIKLIVEWKDIDLHPLEDEMEETQTNDILDEIPGRVNDVVGTRDADTHAYLRFSTRQPTLENNYFAVHFQNGIENDQSVKKEQKMNERRTEGQRMSEIGEGLSQMEQFGNSSDAPMPTSHMSERLSFDGSETEENYPTSVPHMSTYYASLPAATYNEFESFKSNGAHIISGCHIVTLTDSESFDTTQLKCTTIKILENKWPALVNNMSSLIANHSDIENAENCVLNFLQLWENIISVKANLSIVETLPFYGQLDKFELLLNQNLSCTIYKQMLCLFNEALCYGSTLALQDMLPEETCLLAHQIVRHVKDFRILESLPRRQPENMVGMIGFKCEPITYTNGTLQLHCTRSTTSSLMMSGSDVIRMDKTILQKIVLLVLKSVAVTVKEIRSDSSDSSLDSTDCDAFQDMVLIERSIRDVLCKLESFIKHTLEFHPECHFSKILIDLFDDQDDHLIEAMVCALDVTSGISFRNNAFPELVSMLNPVYTFLEFIKMILNSSDLLLDLLVSNETCFLLYLLRFLKYVRMNWSMFVQSCQDFGMGANALDEAMSVLIRLRLQISRLVSRQLYPYDISPVLRLLESCESLYEGNELS